jgi:cyanophycinase
MRIRHALLAAAFVLTAGIAARAQTGARPRGTLMIVGGGPQPPALVQQFVDLAGGRGRAKIAVFGQASEDGKAGGDEKAADLRTLGADATNMWITRAQASTDSVARLLDGMTGVWFIGGDQVKLTAALRGTKTEAAIHALYARGGVVGGTSAGAAVMSEIMITGDERHPGGDRPDTSSAYMTIARDNVVTDSGFAFIRSAIIDQHFLRRKRANRLISLTLERPPHLGVGIDESTALIVGPTGPWRVVGASAVTIYDARRARITPASAHVLGAADLRLHVLPAGATFDPATGTAKLP